MLLEGELAPGTARAVVLVDIVPDMDQSGASRIHNFMYDRMQSGFDSLDEVADMIQEYNPHRPRPTDLDGLRTNLRHRDGRWYWHWDPKFIDGTSALPPIEVTEVDRMHAAVQTIIDTGVPMLLVRGQMSDLVTQERADAFLARFPEVDFVDVGGAGHMVAGDRNDLFAGCRRGLSRPACRATVTTSAAEAGRIANGHPASAGVDARSRSAAVSAAGCVGCGRPSKIACIRRLDAGVCTIWATRTTAPVARRWTAS